MGFKKLLEKAGKAIGKAAKSGAGLALSSIPGGSIAEKILYAKALAGDKKRQMVAAKVARAQSSKVTQANLQALAKKPLVPKTAAKPAPDRKPGLLSADAKALQNLRTGYDAALSRPTSDLAVSLANKKQTKDRQTLKASLNARTKGFTQDDWQELLKRYKASKSKLSWEAWLDTAV